MNTNPPNVHPAPPQRPALFDPAAVVRTFDLFTRPGDVHEVRIIEGVVNGDRFPCIRFGYFNDAARLAAELKDVRSAEGIYFTLNPVNPALLARAENRIKKATKKGGQTADHDITCRRWLYVDCDPVRPAGISSNEREHDAALNRARIIRDELQADGWPVGILADSANGAHLQYPIALPADDGGLVARVLAKLQERFGDDPDDKERPAPSDGVFVKIDSTTANAARIDKLYGTRGCKGDDTPDRPWRMSKLLDVPETIDVVPTEILEQFAGPVVTPVPAKGKASKPRTSGKGRGDGIKLADFIRDHALPVTGPDRWSGDGGPADRWVFDVCPWNPDHVGGSAFVAQFDAGPIFAGCHHNSCKGYGWPDLRRKYDPGTGKRKARPASTGRSSAPSDDLGPNEKGPPTDWEPDRLSQQANAERLAQCLAGVARYNVNSGEYMVYHQPEGRFLSDETGVVNRLAKAVARETWEFVLEPPDCTDSKNAFKHALDSEKASGVAAAMKLAQTEPGIPVTAKEFDGEPFVLNVLDGALDLRTGRLMPHSPERLMTKLAPVHFDPFAACPLWLAFLDRIMASNGAMVGYLQRLAGMMLSADVTVQELYIAWGGGERQKRVFFDTILGMLGDYAGTAPESLLTLRNQTEHPTEIADLCGKRLVVASETEEGTKLRVQLVKRLTGDATLKARFMRQDFFEFPRTHKLVMVTNNRPIIRESTAAVWRRVRLIPFTVTIPPAERDVHLLAKLRGERPGILNWAIAGCLDWLASGIQTPDEVMVATAEYQSEQDDLSGYLAEQCVMGERASVARAKLWESYQEWAKGGDPMDRTTFYDRVRRLEGVGETMHRHGGNPTRVFTGIGIATLGDQYRQAQQRAAGVTP